jgi:ATP-binding cassette, subfamily B, bacterial
VAGETGAGKTTLAYLVARLYEAERGSVTIDGVDVRELSFEALTSTVGLVAQETFLLHATVRENLRFAAPDADDARVEAAARAARIHDLIASLPDGYDTVVGERGHRFSGGERQRIAIARTLLRDPRVLILDEATSALDTRTERLVREALVELAKGRTTITIAHRDATLRDADRIVWLERGSLRDLGERI